jgi:endothelin-converting enzyme/putative endopeptidase
LIATLVLAASSGFGQTPPHTPSLDLTSIDKTVDPCQDLYHFACGGWQKNNPIPADQVSWDITSKMYEDNLVFLRRLLDEAGRAKERDGITQQIGDFYAACTDEAAIARQGNGAIQPELRAIGAVRRVQDLAALVARLQLEFPANPIVFGFGSRTDFDDSNRKIAGITQGGLGLPDRDYYFKNDAEMQETRKRYVQHIQTIFMLLGESPETSATHAASVLRMEAGLASASLTQVERRNPYTTKHKMTVTDLDTLAPNFNWHVYFTAISAPSFDTLNVGAPKFFKEFNALLATEGLEEWKAYLRFHVADSFAPYLSDEFVQENFSFYRKYLRGAKELQPRWKRCVAYTDTNLGEALGQVYVRHVFSAKLKT